MQMRPQLSDPSLALGQVLLSKEVGCEKGWDLSTTDTQIQAIGAP